MENYGKSAIMRLKKVLLNDKTIPSGLQTVLLADLTDLLSGYFDLDAKKLEIDLDLDSGGKYLLKIEVPVERIKDVNIV